MNQHIGLVRHGLTDWNAQGKIQGQTDIPLNATGREQARLLANRLVQEQAPFEYVVSSSLQRAEETASIIANALQIPLLSPEVGLRERAYGLVEGTTPEEREERWGAEWRQMDLGQEKDKDLQLRAVQALEHIAEQHQGSNILIVSHGSWLAQLFVALFGNERKGHIGNLSYSILEKRSEGWHPLLYNCIQHIRHLDLAAKPR